MRFDILRRYTSDLKGPDNNKYPWFRGIHHPVMYIDALRRLRIPAPLPSSCLPPHILQYITNALSYGQYSRPRFASLVAFNFFFWLAIDVWFYVAAFLGFLVPYFDRLVTLFPTPPKSIAPLTK
jgi:hypothetical protein